MARLGYEPIRIDDWAWKRDDIRKALQARDMAGILKFAQRYGGATQGRLALSTGVLQGRISEILKGERQVSSFEVIERIAEGLNMPDAARMLLGLAPRATDYSSRLSDEIACIFPSQQEAAREIQQLMPSARTVHVLAARGLGIIGLNNSLLRESLLAHQPQDAISMRIALLDPSSEFARQRAREIGEPCQAFTRGIELTLDLLQDMASEAAIALEVYLYDELPIWRLISIDEILYASSFNERWEGHESQMYKIKPTLNGPFHSALTRLFRQTCASSRRAI
jgi:transcriptional regulator with XRE-family HTH domain